MTETNTVSPIHDRNTTAGVATADGAASATATKRQCRPRQGTTGGPVAMAICNAITGALKQSCGKGPTKVKAYTMHDQVAVVVEDMLTTLERTLVQNGHEQLVSEARQVLVGRAAKECRATIEQATGRRVVGWQTEVNPTAGSAFTLVQLQPLARVGARQAPPEAPPANDEP
jgi:uncharacterized protein YbcI